jgi:hypothetical protein
LVRAAVLIAILVLAGCSSDDFNRPARIPSYRHPFVTAPANSDFTPPNSLPP